MHRTFHLLNLMAVFVVAGGLYSCKKDYGIQQNHKEFQPDPNFTTNIYIGNHIAGESAESIGSAIGLPPEKSRALGDAIREHESRLQKIKDSDYAPYLLGLLHQNENERYRNSIIEAVGRDYYHKWFDYDRSAMDKKLKETYGFDDERLARFKDMVKQYDIEVREVLRQFWSKEQKKERLLPVIEKKDSALRTIIDSDIPFEDIIMRRKEIKI